MNTEVQIENGMYFLLLSIVILASVIFIIHLLEEGRERITEIPEQNEMPEKAEETAVLSRGGFTPPFEVDLDLLAENIIPRIDMREKIEDYAERILRNLSRHFEIVQGVFFLKNQITDVFESISTFAYNSEKNPSSFKVGEGIPGQVAKSKKLMYLTTIPEGYLKIQSGLGKSSPENLLIIPLMLNKETIGIIELASFKFFDQEKIWTLKNLARMIGNAIVTKVKATEEN